MQQQLRMRSHASENAGYFSKTPGRIARQALDREVVEVVAPHALLLAPEPKEVFPTVDTGRMHVVEHQPHRIVADRLDFHNRYIAFTGHGFALLRGMTLHLGAGRLNAEELGGKFVRLAGFEGDAQRLLVFVQPQFGRPGAALRSHQALSHYVRHWSGRPFFSNDLRDLCAAPPLARTGPNDYIGPEELVIQMVPWNNGGV